MNDSESRRGYVVRGHAAARAEVAEVERRAVDGAAASAGPLDLGDLLAAALGGLGERLGLEHARVERRGAVAERLAVHVEGVVGRAVHARPGARVEREPAGARVRRRLRQQAVAGGPRALAEEVAEAGHDALVGVLLDRVLAQAVGGEEEELVVAALVVAAAVTAALGERPAPRLRSARPAPTAAHQRARWLASTRPSSSHVLPESSDPSFAAVTYASRDRVVVTAMRLARYHPARGFVRTTLRVASGDARVHASIRACPPSSHRSPPACSPRCCSPGAPPPTP